jgi:hypothetical protein
MRRFVVLLLALAIAAGCQTPSPQSENAISSVSLERIATGLSTGPEYLVTLEASGRVMFERRGFSRTGETFRKRVSPAEVAAVFARAEQLHFETLRDSYRGGASTTKAEREEVIALTPTDLPTQIVTVTRGTASKRVEDYYEPPPGLAEFEDLIDKTAGVADWLKRR